MRQSTLTQVEQNQESRARQYALRERATEFGWAPSAVDVVDEDLGRSGASSEGRLGFKELVAAVGLGQVGLVLLVDPSENTFGRSGRIRHRGDEVPEQWRRSLRSS